jgi:hypothetical protein
MLIPDPQHWLTTGNPDIWCKIWQSQSVSKLKSNKDNFSMPIQYKCFATIFYFQCGGAEVLCPGDKPAAAGGEAHHVEGHAHCRTDQEGEQHPGDEKSSFFKRDGRAKLVARLLSVATHSGPPLRLAMIEERKKLPATLF